MTKEPPMLETYTDDEGICQECGSYETDCACPAGPTVPAAPEHGDGCRGLPTIEQNADGLWSAACRDCQFAVGDCDGYQEAGGKFFGADGPGWYGAGWGGRGYPPVLHNEDADDED